MHWSDRPPWRVGDWDWLSLGSDAGRGLKDHPDRQANRHCSRTRSSACPSSLYVPLPQRGMPRTVHSMEKPYVFGAVAILQPPGDLLIYHQAKPFELRIDRSASTNAKPCGLPCDRRRELRATRSSCSILTVDPKRASVPSRCPCMSSMLGFKHKYCGCLIADRLGGDPFSSFARWSTAPTKRSLSITEPGVRFGWSRGDQGLPCEYCSPITNHRRRFKGTKSLHSMER